MNILGPRGVQITETLRYVKQILFVYKAGHFPFNAQLKNVIYLGVRIVKIQIIEVWISDFVL